MNRVIIKNSKKEKLVGILHKCKGKSKGLIILSHGFRGFKELPLMKTLSELFTTLGFDAFRFDFSGNGESEGLFGHSGLIKEKNDLLSVIKHFKEYKNIILFGHSMGGAVSIISASKYKRVRAVIVLSCLVFPSISFKDAVRDPTITFAILEKNHKVHKTPKKLSKSIIENAEELFQELVERKVLHMDFFKQMRKVDVTDYFEELKKPTLIIHGKRDFVIPVSHAEYLYNQNRKYSSLVIIDAFHNLYLKKDINVVFNHVRKWLDKIKLENNKLKQI